MCIFVCVLMSHGDVTKSYGMHIAAVNEMIKTCEDKLGQTRVLGPVFLWETNETASVQYYNCWKRASKLNKLLTQVDDHGIFGDLGYVDEFKDLKKAIARLGSYLKKSNKLSDAAINAIKEQALINADADPNLPKNQRSKYSTAATTYWDSDEEDPGTLDLIK